MTIRYILLVGLLFFLSFPTQIVKAETISNVDGMYVTTEDIIFEIIFPTIDQRVTKEYGKETFVSWQWKRIVGITYNDNHSYDVVVRIEVPVENGDYSEDLVTVRISPSCDSDKINKLKCNHEFKVDILDYEHVSP
ncbi:DUF3888 domain-containing protein [Litchfieldia salsa]|uniref:DUF3888 domain-containing protein n=1 Tax=Litchfieldia salsa TaxID=930152 RepID=A0A1H0T1N0_9BACI|nr:DUF3888 domain-containing protein [Litchfieldia salsa]SDP47691.1 Protein of unknown function [Litchfieldia salsa]